MYYATFPLSAIKAKLNAEQLKAELVAKTGYATEDISLSVCHGGTVTRMSGYVKDKKLVEESVEETIPAEITVGLPDNTRLARVVEALEDHAPSLDDHEACAVKKKEEFNAKLLESDAFKSLMSKASK